MCGNDFLPRVDYGRPVRRMRFCGDGRCPIYVVGAACEVESALLSPRGTRT